MKEEEFEKKWNGKEVETMTDEEFREFKQDCFAMYEETGFLEKFDSPYDDIGGGEHEHNGMAFKVIRRANEGEADLESMPLWLVQFENGDTAFCYPEEITVVEHEARNRKN